MRCIRGVCSRAGGDSCGARFTRRKPAGSYPGDGMSHLDLETAAALEHCA